MFNQYGPVNNYKDHVGPGWGELLDQLHAELILVDPDYQTVQVKEKFGLLRVYISGTPIQGDMIGPGAGHENFRLEGTATKDNWHTLQDIVDKYERLSADICEYCGAPGGMDTSHYWWKTRCEKCKQERNKEK